MSQKELDGQLYFDFMQMLRREATQLTNIQGAIDEIIRGRVDLANKIEHTHAVHINPSDNSNRSIEGATDYDRNPDYPFLYCAGPKDGDCGHYHQTFLAARGCLTAHEATFQGTDQDSDRSVMFAYKPKRHVELSRLDGSYYGFPDTLEITRAISLMEQRTHLVQ